MNRRIKKKKLKQRLTQEEAIEQLSIKLAEAILELKREYWRLYIEESTRQFAEAVFRHCERQRLQRQQLRVQLLRGGVRLLHIICASWVSGPLCGARY